jgi:hypothetical protein
MRPKRSMTVNQADKAQRKPLTPLLQGSADPVYGYFFR